MKTKIVMAVMGIFFALSTVSYANSFNKLPECCKKQEVCCVKDAACCQGNNVAKESSDCCEQQKACCGSNAYCCVSAKVNDNYKDQFHSKVNREKSVSCDRHKTSCCK